MALDAPAQAGQQGIAIGFLAGDRDDGEAPRQHLVEQQVVQRGHELASHQVAGRAEQDERTRQGGLLLAGHRPILAKTDPRG